MVVEAEGQVVPTVARNATLADLADLLKRQADLKVDAVVTAPAIQSVGGIIKVKGMSVFGETSLTPTAIMDEGLAEKLGIPGPYLRELRNGRPQKKTVDARAARVDLYDANVNGWLHGLGHPGADSVVMNGAIMPTIPADPRKFFLRAFVDPGTNVGIARSIQSDRFAPIDNQDVLMAAVDGINQSGEKVVCLNADLTERRMVVRFGAPEVGTLAPKLSEGYRSPLPGTGWDVSRWLQIAEREGMGYEPGTVPVVFAGFELTNGENGGSAFNLAPRIIMQVCKNGLKLDVGKLRRVHLGSQLSEGIIQFSEDTQQKTLALVTAQTRDAVQAFLKEDFVKEVVAELEKEAGKPVDSPVETVELVAKKLRFTEQQQAGILDLFIKGSQITAGGVMQAVTAYAQTVEDPDEAYDLEGVAVQAMSLAAA